MIVGFLKAVVELELDETADGVQRIEIGQVQLALRLAHLAVGALEHREIGSSFEPK